MSNSELTSIEEEDRAANEGCHVEATIQFSQIPADHGTQDEAYARGCVELSQHKWPLLLCDQVRKQCSGDGEGMFKNTCKGEEMCTVTFRTLKEQTPSGLLFITEPNRVLVSIFSELLRLAGLALS